MGDEGRRGFISNTCFVSSILQRLPVPALLVSFPTLMWPDPQLEGPTASARIPAGQVPFTPSRLKQNRPDSHGRCPHPIPQPQRIPHAAHHPTLSRVYPEWLGLTTVGLVQKRRYDPPRGFALSGLCGSLVSPQSNHLC